MSYGQQCHCRNEAHQFVSLLAIFPLTILKSSIYFKTFIFQGYSCVVLHVYYNSIVVILWNLRMDQI